MAAVSLNRVEIDLGALRDNYAAIRAVVGPQARVMAVVKSDGYGHGMVQVARTLREAGASTFGVAEVEEGVRLRESGQNGEIVVLHGVRSGDFDEVVRFRLTPVVFDRGVLADLARYAVRRHAMVGVHVKVDVGMGRLGIMPEEVIPFVRAVDLLEGVYLAGVLSHLPVADVPASPKTREQVERFRDVLARIGRVSPFPKVGHIANSAALHLIPDAHLDMVRPGIVLYGCDPGGTENLCAEGLRPSALKPAMTFKTEVLQVKEVPAGYGISYGHTFVTSRPSRVAVLPVGYADGYPRRLSSRAEVLLHGHRAPVIGRVCMNACMVDVTDLPEAIRAGDEVVLMGRQGDGTIRAEELAGWMETINYEVLCLLGNLNRRVYLEDTR